MRTIRKHQLIFTLINAFLAISSAIVTIVTITQGTVAGQVDTGGSYGLFYLATFTMDSNIFLGVVAAVATVLGLRNLKQLKPPKHPKPSKAATATIKDLKNTKGLKPRRPLPPSLTIWYLVATTSAVLTFITVVCFLAPKRALEGKNYFDMLLGPMFFFHFFNPVLAAINLIFFAPAQRLTKGDRLLALAPMLIYALFYFFAVVVFEAWNDFYGFTFGGHTWAILPVFVVMNLAVFAIASLLAYLHNRRLTHHSHKGKFQSNKHHSHPNPQSHPPAKEPTPHSQDSSSGKINPTPQARSHPKAAAPLPIYFL